MIILGAHSNAFQLHVYMYLGKLRVLLSDGATFWLAWLNLLHVSKSFFSHLNTSCIIDIDSTRISSGVYWDFSEFSCNNVLIWMQIVHIAKISAHRFEVRVQSGKQNGTSYLYNAYEQHVEKTPLTSSLPQAVASAQRRTWYSEQRMQVIGRFSHQWP